jgi:hypothetical protein
LEKKIIFSRKEEQSKAGSKVFQAVPRLFPEKKDCLFFGKAALACDGSGANQPESTLRYQKVN